MRVRLRLFAALREIAGQEELDLEVPAGTSAGAVWEMLLSDYPKLSNYTKAIQVAVNHDFADRRAELKPNDEIAFLPPVSGG